MFPARFFAASYFAPRHFPEIGAVLAIGNPGTAVSRVTSSKSAAKAEVKQ